MAQTQTYTKSQALRHQLEGAFMALKFTFLYFVLPMAAIVTFFAFKDVDRRIESVNREVAQVRAENADLAAQLAFANKRINHERVVSSTEPVRVGVRQAVLRGDASGTCVTLVHRYVADPVTGFYDAEKFERNLTSVKGRCSA